MKFTFPAFILSFMTIHPGAVKADEAPALPLVVSKQAKISSEQANEYVRQVFGAIESELKAGRTVAVAKFGRFSVLPRKAVEKKDPQTGKTSVVPGKKLPHFNSDEQLRLTLNN